MQVSVCLGAILILEYLDSISAILLPGAEKIYSGIHSYSGIFPNERAQRDTIRNVKSLIKVLQHALFCHVCNRSLCINSVEAEMAEE